MPGCCGVNEDGEMESLTGVVSAGEPVEIRKLSEIEEAEAAKVIDRVRAARARATRAGVENGPEVCGREGVNCCGRCGA